MVIRNNEAVKVRNNLFIICDVKRDDIPFTCFVIRDVPKGLCRLCKYDKKDVSFCFHTIGSKGISTSNL